jgi:hypothetical protein
VEVEATACPFDACDFVGTSAADLADHLLIRSYTDPAGHPDDQP